ncbi:MAG TPA: hypothetical protein PLE43_01320 [Alphaproteobacteria bacterium]|nr:hypothetical protein [Alphaproteobacteria bacterium]
MATSSSYVRRFMAAAATVAFMGGAASASFAAECLPGIYNAQAGVKWGDCYYTAEINKAMKDYGQKSLIVGDNIYAGKDGNGVLKDYLRVNRFTASDDGSLGFNVEGNNPSNQPSTEWRVAAVIKNVRLYDSNKFVVPSEEIVGRRNAEGIRKTGDRVMLSGEYNGKYMVVVRSADKPSIGNFMGSDNTSGVSMAAYTNLDYTDLGKSIIKSQRSASLVGPILAQK